MPISNNINKAQVEYQKQHQDNEHIWSWQREWEYQKRKNFDRLDGVVSVYGPTMGIAQSKQNRQAIYPGIPRFAMDQTDAQLVTIQHTDSYL